MFTGIIEGLGTVREVASSGKGKQLAIEADFSLQEVKIGDSIAVNGICLTATAIRGRSFKVDVSPETLKMSTFGNVMPGLRVNLERALRLSDRLDGHLVSGHIDGTGVIAGRKTESNAIIISFSVPGSLGRYMIKKGSVAVDGVSLTINNCHEEGFDVSIIPHTAKLTTVGFKKQGEPVNIETDMIGKYVERFVTGKPITEKEKNGSALNMEFLAKTGFL